MNSYFKKYLQTFLLSVDLFIMILIIINFDFSTINRLTFEYYYTFNYSILILFWIVVSFFTGTYSGSGITNFNIYNKKTFYTYVGWLFIVLIFHQHELYYLTQFGYQLIYFTAGLILVRFLYFGLILYFKQKDYLLNNIIIIGYNNTSKKLAQYIQKESVYANLIGFAEDSPNITEVSHYPIVSNIKNVISVAKMYKVHEIFSTIIPTEKNHLREIIHQAEDSCIRIKIVPDMFSSTSTDFSVMYNRAIPVISIHNEALDDIGNKIIKRIFDLLISTLVIVLIFPWLLPLIAILLKIDSRGPLFFSQKRTGKNNEIFNCYKFRTMRVNHDADMIQATKDDKRVTRLGKFLRKSSIDEFPQFINVFRGEMSIVGPRPLMIRHTEQYSKIVEQYMLRHFLKPGITGWSQINGLRGEIKNNTAIINRVRNDIWYFENWTLGLDIKIFVLTIVNMFKKDSNAY